MFGSIMHVTESPIPESSLLFSYVQVGGHYTDCFACATRKDVDLCQYISAFYTQPLFRCERLVLRLFAHVPSSDADVAALADGRADTFAVWRVVSRTDDELLMQDKSGRTMSWLQVAEGQLRFGSVVVPVPGRGGKPTLGPVFQSLLGAHQLYSRALLAGAVRKLRVG